MQIFTEVCFLRFFLLSINIDGSLKKNASIDKNDFLS